MVGFLRAVLVTALVCAGAGTAFGYGTYLTAFESAYPAAVGKVIDSCGLCHINPAGGGTRNSFGGDFASAAIGNHTFNATLAARDSDGDGYTNSAEIKALTWPGDATSHPSAGGDTTAPKVTAFSMPATSTSLTVPITTFTATDNVGVTGYKVTVSSTKPLASATGWSATAPKSHTFGTAGTKTLYAWAKDAAGNVSASRSATVTISLSASLTGAQLYTKYCATCHGPLASSSVRGESVSDIREAISQVGAMAGLKSLTLTQLQKVANALGGGTGGTETTSSTSVQSQTSATTSSTAGRMPLPSGAQIFSYATTATPVRSDDPSAAKPVGVGTVATGGKTLDLQVSAGFGSAVDVYLTLYVPAEKPTFAPVEVYVLQPNNTFKALSAGGSVVPWRTNTTGINTQVTGSLPVDTLPAGQYVLILTVVPSGTEEGGYYEWITNFIVP